MKLYVCWGLFKTPGPGHPCRNAYDALADNGYSPQVIKCHGWGLLPDALNRTKGRQEVKRLTGDVWVPLLVTDEGDVIKGSKEIARWAARPSASSRPSGSP